MARQEGAIAKKITPPSVEPLTRSTTRYRIDHGKAKGLTVMGLEKRNNDDEIADAFIVLAKEIQRQKKEQNPNQVRNRILDG